MSLSGLKPFFNRVLAGLILVVPLWVTLLTAGFLYRTIDGILRPISTWSIFSQFFGETTAHHPVLEFLIVVTLAVLLLYLLGLLSTTYLAQSLYEMCDRFLLRIPLLKSIYGLSKQVVDLLATRSGESFKAVVLVEFPRAGCYTLGFLTGHTHLEGEPSALVNVFVPTTPNPTGGYMLLLPRESVRKVEMSVENAIKMILSGGAITPETLVFEKKG